jgi:hypothetical protein
MSDINCTHCKEEQEINHDDGYGYEEGETHKQYCHNCKEYFFYTTTIINYYCNVNEDGYEIEEE